MEHYSCRICMRTDAKLEQISLYCERKGEVIANMIIDCADVMVSHDDQLPENVCSSCLKRLEEAFTLRALIRQSDSSLRALVRKMNFKNPKPESHDPIKHEVPLMIEDTLPPPMEKSFRKATGSNAGKTISYPTEEQIESIETFETHKVIRLKGVRCCGCESILATKQDLFKHSLEEHSQKAAMHSKDQVAFQCPICYERFQNRMKLLNHTKNYESNEVFHCTMCDVLFDIKYRLQQHQTMSKSHKKQTEAMTVEYLEEEIPRTVFKKRPHGRKRVCKELKYPSEDYILSIDETPEYEVIHLGGERCCGCELMFKTKQELEDHCRKVHSRREEDAAFECPLCFEQFDQAQSFTRHKSARLLKELYFCKFCDIVIDVKFRFDQHLKSSVAHQAAVVKAGIETTFPIEERSATETRALEASIQVLEISDIRCCGCNFVCKNRAELNHHSEKIHAFERVPDDDRNPFECNICFQRFTKPSGLTYHRNQSLQKTVYKCKQCEMHSEIKHRILQHLGSSAHQSTEKENKTEAEPKLYACCFVRCTITFEDPNDLVDHVEDVHQAKRRENAQDRESDGFICYVCHKSFRNEKSLQLHQFPRRADSQQHVCKTCGANFLYLSTLVSHEKTHIVDREFQCDLCEKSFYDERTLRIHKVCHNAERPFVCNICAKSFLRKGNLKVHKRCHAESIWDCTHCHEKFKTKQSLVLHTRYHTGEKPFQCRYCENRYSHSTDRKRHEMAAHTKVRPHKCLQCPAEFIRKRQLTIHERIHSGERPFVCQICDKRFIQLNYLTKHLATHENDEPSEETMKETEYVIEMLHDEAEEDYNLVEVLDEERENSEAEVEDEAKMEQLEESMEEEEESL